jgi:hypothetical protein
VAVGVHVFVFVLVLLCFGHTMEGTYTFLCEVSQVRQMFWRPAFWGCALFASQTEHAVLPLSTRVQVNTHV